MTNPKYTSLFRTILRPSGSRTSIAGEIDSVTGVLIALIVLGAVVLLIVLIRTLVNKREERYKFPDPPDIEPGPGPGPVRPPKIPTADRRGDLVIPHYLDSSDTHVSEEDRSPGRSRLTFPVTDDSDEEDVYRDVKVLMVYPSDRGMVKCPWCEAENAQGYEFCLSCGRSRR